MIDEIERGRLLASAHEDIQCLGPLVASRTCTPEQRMAYHEAVELVGRMTSRPELVKAVKPEDAWITSEILANSVQVQFKFMLAIAAFVMLVVAGSVAVVLVFTWAMRSLSGLL